MFASLVKNRFDEAWNYSRTSQGKIFLPSLGYGYRLTIDHFTVVAKLPGLTMEARLPVTLF